MRTIKFSPELVKKLQIIKKKDSNLFRKIQKQLTIFKQNPHHRSLRRHRITREVKNVWSISIDKNIWMLYMDENNVYFFDIGTHDEVYRK